MRILLIAPRSEFPDVTPGWLQIPQMSLMILEALSQPKHKVTAVEEEAEIVPFDKNWDLVGITVMTATAPRAYDIADMFRKRGIKVVLGGMHVSILTEEAVKHADSVVVGEAEGVWGQILKDAQNNNLKPIYANPKPDINLLPIVHYNKKRRLFKPSLAPVVASRGCPNDCEFCCVPKVYGRYSRRLPVERVLEQIELGRADYIAFLDDNLAANRKWALKLLIGLKRSKVKFIFQIPVSFILDDEVFFTAIKAGLKGVFVGIETIDEQALTNFNKSVSLEGYVKAIRRCRENGVLLHASLIFGLDEHDRSIFDRTLEFIIKHKVSSASAYVLTPYPGTDLYKRMLYQGRLLHQNWAFYDHVTPVFQPALMNIEDLAEDYMQFRERLFSFKDILKRLPSQLFMYPGAYIGLSMGFRRTTYLLKEHYKRYFMWLQKHPSKLNA